MLTKAIKSRTVWTVIVMFVLGGIQNISQFITPELFVLIETILSGLVIYFKLKPSQSY